MNCSRCLGLMVEDLLLDCKGAYREMWARSLRCVNCGRIYDSVIEQNLLARQEKVLVPSSDAPDYQNDQVPRGAESFIRRAS